MTLQALGWNSFFDSLFLAYQRDGFVAGRVTAEHRGLYLLHTETGDIPGEISGKFRHQTQSSLDFPAVGDWVVIQPGAERAIIHQVLPRKSIFVRKAVQAGVEAQVIAANVDTAFLVSGLDHDFNPRRIERYLLLALESGAKPVIVLNKADVCDDLGAAIADVEAILPQRGDRIPIVTLSALQSSGLGALQPYLVPSQTVVLLGSSGVGKSTLMNQLMGDAVQPTQSVRQQDSRGRHTTTHRELFRVPGGVLLLDTPGMRELQPWVAESSLPQTFDDIEVLAAQCRFRDCRHQHEPGCAVQDALASGELARDRLTSYLKLQREMQHLARQQDEQQQRAEKQRWKQIHQQQRVHQKHKYGSR